MKKYVSIFKMSFLDSFQYIPSILFKFISYFLTMFIFTNLWSYIYNDPNKLINGYTLNQMIWYLLIAETISYGCSSLCQKEIENDIKNGDISYKVNKPYNYVGYVFSRYLGDSIIRFILYFVVSFLIGNLFVGKINVSLNIFSILEILLTIILGISINGLIKILISLSAFWTEDSSPFHWIYSKVMLIFGIFFPIEMFPKFLRPIIKCTPVFVILYGPAKLILSFSNKLFLNVLVAQIIYLIIVLLLITIIYRKGVKKINVNGG